MKQNLLSKMLFIAANYHDGQFDRGGVPYMLHVIRVMQYLPSDADEELKCIALGHDLCEDTKVTYQLLQDSGFSDRVIEGIRCLTKVAGETFEEYKAKVLSNRDAMLVKRCDLKDNSDINRLNKDKLSQSDIDRLRKYFEFMLEIEEKLRSLWKN